MNKLQYNPAGRYYQSATKQSSVTEEMISQCIVLRTGAWDVYEMPPRRHELSYLRLTACIAVVCAD